MISAVKTLPNKPKARMDNAHEREDDWSKLLQRVAKTKDESAFSALFAHFAPLIKGFCQANLSYLSFEASEELVQEVMIKVWQKSPHFDATKASASTWIFTITRNTRIDYLRKNRKHDIHCQSLESEDIWDESLDNQPFVYLKQNREEHQVNGYLKSLPDEQSECLVKVYREGKSHSEIADELRLPLGTVKSRVRLGLKKIQSFVAPV